MRTTDLHRYDLTGQFLLAVDPGDKNIGVSVWRNWPRVEETFNGVVTAEELLEALNQDGNDGWDCSIEQVVVEDYRLDKSRNRGGQRMLTSEVIGMLRLFSSITYDCELVRQRPEARKVAAMHAGIELPQGHTPDDLSAHLHAVYRLEELGLIQATNPALL
jgi:hypothetical protein